MDYLTGSLAWGFFRPDLLVVIGSRRECSQMLLAPLLWRAWTMASWDGIQVPFLRDLMWETCLPRVRWTLQHSSQRRMPLLMEAHVGSERNR